jgi:hypothetical protein
MGQQQQQTMAVAEKEVVRSMLRRTMLALITAALVVAMMAVLGADLASAKDRTNISSSGNILNSSHDNTSNDGGPTGGGPAQVERQKYSTSGYDFHDHEVSTSSGNVNKVRVGNCRVDSACI